MNFVCVRPTLTFSKSAHCRWLCKAEAASMPLLESTYGIDTRPFPTACALSPSPRLLTAAETSSCEIGSRATPPHV
ncbi:unnamed protein product [Colias eurytheme]|nr:unnamed protein product [Colias eurytheme]